MLNLNYIDSNDFSNVSCENDNSHRVINSVISFSDKNITARISFQILNVKKTLLVPFVWCIFAKMFARPNS